MPDSVPLTSFVNKRAFFTVLVILGVPIISAEPGTGAATKNNFLKIVQANQGLNVDIRNVQVLRGKKS